MLTIPLPAQVIFSVSLQSSGVLCRSTYDLVTCCGDESATIHAGTSCIASSYRLLAGILSHLCSLAASFLSAGIMSQMSTASDQAILYGDLNCTLFFFSIGDV